MSPWTHSLQVVSCGLELKACVDKHPWGPWDSLMSHLVLIKPREPICLQFRMILPCVKLKKEKKKKPKNPSKSQKTDLAENQWTALSISPLSPPAWIYFFLLWLALLGQHSWITEITCSNSCLQLNYAETRLSQLENCHCEKTCQMSGLLYRDQDSWVDGDHCRNCTCKVSLFVHKQTNSLKRAVLLIIV